jgi:GNAT superfamily N-acetyltransferase
MGAARSDQEIEMAVDIRDCSAGDFEQVLELLQQLWPEADLDGPRLEKVFAASREVDTDECFCAVEDDRIIGFCTMSVKNSLLFAGLAVYVDILIVREGFRKTGVGASLLDTAAQVARDHGCVALELDSGFQRTGAHEFYKAQGFKQLGFLFGKSL